MALANKVYFCRNCTHAASSELANASSFYASDYRISLESEDHDQIYRVDKFRPVYRSDVQAVAVLDTVNISPGATILDFGCAKASTLKKVVSLRPDLRPKVFDVSDDYRAYWDGWIADGDAATFQVPPSWEASADVVTAHYVFEHIHQLDAALKEIRFLLKKDGTLFLSVPDWTQNWGDLLVVDHVNHFTPSSLRYLLLRGGFKHIDIRNDVLPAALVVIASLKLSNENTVEQLAGPCPPGKIFDVGNFWLDAYRRMERLSKRLQNTKAAIYGAGFYGAWIASQIKERVEISCFIDANPHIAGKSLFGIPVVSPDEAIAADTILIGLNPAHARRTAREIPILRSCGHLVFIDAEDQP